MSRFRMPRVVAQLLLATTIALLLGAGVVSPARAGTMETVSYVDDGGVSQSVSATVVDGSISRFGDLGDPSWYVVTSDTTISERIEISGDVNLILADGACLTASQGIHVYEGQSLTIYAREGGTGKLVATGQDRNSGIGGDAAENCGAVTINGGVVEARGHTGIGGGQAQINIEDGGDGGVVTINGGRVTAIGKYGAGIGGGVRGGTTNNGAGGTVVITGGTVHAESEGAGAGIGGGGMEAEPANVTISNAVVVAIAGPKDDMPDIQDDENSSYKNCLVFERGEDSGKLDGRAFGSFCLADGDIPEGAASLAISAGASLSGMSHLPGNVDLRLSPSDSLEVVLNRSGLSRIACQEISVDASSGAVKLTLVPTEGYSMPGSVEVAGESAEGVAHSYTRADDMKSATLTLSFGGDAVSSISLVGSALSPVVAENFAFSVPVDLTYSGTPKTASLSSTSGVPSSAITLSYYDENGQELKGAPVSVGTYKVKAQIAETGTTAPGTVESDDWTFEIKPATLTVTPDDLAVPFGTDLPKLTYEISGFVPGEGADEAGIAGEPVVACPGYERGVTEAGATCDIVADVSGMSARNYVFVGGTGTLTVTRAAVAAQHAVAFDDCLASTEDATVVVAHGATVPRPADPVLDGWRFLGWYSDAALSQAWDFSAPVTSDLTLYAKWERVAGAAHADERPATPDVSDSLGGGEALAKTGDPTAVGAPLALAALGLCSLVARRHCG